MAMRVQQWLTNKSEVKHARNSRVVHNRHANYVSPCLLGGRGTVDACVGSFSDAQGFPGRTEGQLAFK